MTSRNPESATKKHLQPRGKRLRGTATEPKRTQRRTPGSESPISRLASRLAKIERRSQSNGKTSDPPDLEIREMGFCRGSDALGVVAMRVYNNLCESCQKKAKPWCLAGKGVLNFPHLCQRCRRMADKEVKEEMAWFGLDR